MEPRIKHKLGYDVYEKESHARILELLAKFADEILVDLKHDKITIEQVEPRIDAFIEYLDWYNLKPNSYQWTRIATMKERVYEGRYYRTNKYYFSFSEFRDGWNEHFILTIKREEFKRIIYQFLLDQELDLQGFCIYLRYDKRQTRLNFKTSPIFNSYIKSLINKDIPVRHIDSLENFTITASMQEVEKFIDEVKTVL